MLAALLPLAFCLSARAQFFGGTYGSAPFTIALNSIYGTNFWTNTQVISATTTNFILPPATNATASAVSLFNYRNVPLQIRFWPQTVGATGTITFTKSLDAVTWDTNNLITLSASGTAAGIQVAPSTNVDFGGYGYVCPYSFVSSGSISNLNVNYAGKPGF